MLQSVSPPPDAAMLDMRWGYALEAEQSVLGGLLLDNTAWDRVGDLLSESDFYSNDHRLIFACIMHLIECNKPADALTVAEALNSRGKLSAVDGGREYIGTLALNTPSAANVRRYAEIVRERAMFRAIFSECNALIDAVRRPGDRDARQILDVAQARIFALGERSAGGADFESSNQLMTRVVEFVDQQYQRNSEAGGDSAVTGLATGFIDFDRMTSGLHPGQLMVLAARPAMGKSSLALNISEQVARAGVGVAFFSLEMGNKEQGIRLVASSARLNTQRLFSGRINEQEWPRVVDSVGKLIELPIFFNESPYLSVMEMRTLARRLKRQEPRLGLVVLDYLQLMVAGGNEQNRANQIAEISRGLKLLAKELQLPVIALAQLNRELEKRTNKRPVLSDLRDSGAIEQDADLVVFIYRDEVYQPTLENKGHAELIVAKQRNGPIGSVEVRFRADNTTFENWS